MKVRITDENGTVKWKEKEPTIYKYIDNKWVLMKNKIKQKNNNKWVDKNL